jgi:hypothetical protein
MQFHLDQEMSEADFAQFEEELRQASQLEIEEMLAFCEGIVLEAAMFRDECYGCVHQADNGPRAAELAQAELDRRKQRKQK